MWLMVVKHNESDERKPKDLSGGRSVQDVIVFELINTVITVFDKRSFLFFELIKAVMVFSCGTVMDVGSCFFFSRNVPLATVSNVVDTM